MVGLRIQILRSKSHLVESIFLFTVILYIIFHSYQLFHKRNVVVKSSTGAHLWDNLQALNVTLDQTQVSALDALNKNKRSFTFKG